MLISGDNVINVLKHYNIPINGVLHIGAHECEELPLYETYLQRNQIVWIDALPDKVELSKGKFPNILIENAVVSDLLPALGVFNG